MFILRALDANGGEFFWNGRAGAAWVGPKAEAFRLDNLGEARRKAALFNGRMALHGLRFIAVPVNGEAA